MTLRTPALEALLDAVRHGSVERIPGLLEPVDDTARRACLPVLKRLDRELRDGHDHRVRQALYVAGAGCQTGAASAARLRIDRHTPVLVMRPFEVEGAGALLERHDGADRVDPAWTWKSALVELAASGVLDREALLDRCVGRLLLGGDRAQELRGFWNLLDHFEPTEEELAARTRDWARLVANGTVPTAGCAQALLRRLWEAGTAGWRGVGRGVVRRFVPPGEEAGRRPAGAHRSCAAANVR